MCIQIPVNIEVQAPGPSFMTEQLKLKAHELRYVQCSLNDEMLFDAIALS